MYYVFGIKEVNLCTVMEEGSFKEEEKELALFTVEELPPMPKAKEGHVLNLVFNENKDGIEYAYFPIFTAGNATLKN